MLPSALLATLLAAMIAPAAAVRPPRGYQGPDCTNKHCYTSFASTKTKSVHTSTFYHTVTATVKRTTTVHPTVTVTPTSKTVSTTTTFPATSTVTGIATTNTATVISTTTVTTTSTAPTSTLTGTITTTVTTTTSDPATTVTIAAPAGFSAIQDTLPNSFSKRSVKRSIQQSAKFLAARKAREALQNGAIRLPDCRTTKPAYPASVECEVYSTKTTTVTTTRTGSTSTKTASSGTITTTISTTSTSTSTVFPPTVTSTITSTLTTTNTITTTPSTSTTVTVTSTSTSTIPAPPVSTFYAACGSRNFAQQGPSAGDYIIGDVFPGAETETSDTTAYDCCVSCSLIPGCGLAFFFIQAQVCIIGTNDVSQCTAGSASFQSTAQISRNDNSPQITMSNGPCGEATSYDDLTTT